MMPLIVEICADLADALLGAWFVTRFCGGRFRGNWLLLPAVLVPFLFQITADRFFPSLGLWGSVIQFLLILAYALLISGRHRIRALVSVCILKGILIALSSLLFLVFGLLFRDFESILMGGDGIARAVYVMTHKVLLLAFLGIILRYLKRDNLGRAGGWLTFAFSLIAVLGLGFTIDATMKSGSQAQRVSLLVVALIFCLLDVFLYVLLSLLSSAEKQTYDLRLRSEVAASEAERYREGLSAWQNAEKLRHDVKNQLTAAAGLLDSGDADGCRELLAGYLAKAGSGKRFAPSGNAVIDYLIDAKLAGLENTEIVVTGTVDSLDDIEPTDLASLVGNILDNAVEAEEKIEDRRIELLFTHSGGTRFIVCKNNIDASVVDRVLDENGELRTTKKGPHHGYGTKIVAEIAQKYNGMVEYFESGGMFGVQIMLPESAADTNPSA